uniref:Translocon-associated protein subunit alpha n=1 Tax=Parastrongyloides trichosuri TaxID=131310 RepID=A0A0N4ZNK4_PARTI
MKQSLKCNLKNIQFIDSLIETIKIIVGKKHLLEKDGVFKVNVNDEEHFFYRALLKINDNDMYSKVYLYKNGGLFNGVCIGYLPTKFIKTIKITLAFNKGKTKLDYDDSFLVPFGTNVTYNLDTAFPAHQFFLLYVVIIMGYILFLVIYDVRGNKKRKILKKKVSQNLENKRRVLKFDELLRARYEMLKNEVYPSHNDIISLPKYRSLRSKFLELRKGKNRRNRQKAEKRGLHKKNVSVDNKIKRSKNRFFDKRKIKVSKEQVCGPSKETNVDGNDIQKLNNKRRQLKNI